MHYYFQPHSGLRMTQLVDHYRPLTYHHDGPSETERAKLPVINIKGFFVSILYRFKIRNKWWVHVCCSIVYRIGNTLLLLLSQTDISEFPLFIASWDIDKVLAESKCWNSLLHPLLTWSVVLTLRKNDVDIAKLSFNFNFSFNFNLGGSCVSYILQ